MVQEQIVRCRKRSVSPSAKLSSKLIRSVKIFSCISLPTDSPFFVRNPKVNVEEEPWVKLNTVQLGYQVTAILKFYYPVKFIT